jgi:protein-tyrosine phosphatase
MNQNASVLFVCLGNICRSPLAEAAFRRAAERAGLEVTVDSAGTGDWHVGHAPDPRAQDVARKSGVEISQYRARQLEPDDFHRFTHVLVMDHQNLKDARHIKPAGAATSPRLLLDLVPGREGAAVADPYYGGEENFDYCWADVCLGADALVRLLISER